MALSDDWYFSEKEKEKGGNAYLSEDWHILLYRNAAFLRSNLIIYNINKYSNYYHLHSKPKKVWTLFILLIFEGLYYAVSTYLGQSIFHSCPVINAHTDLQHFTDNQSTQDSHACLSLLTCRSYSSSSWKLTVHRLFSKIQIKYTKLKQGRIYPHLCVRKHNN